MQTKRTNTVNFASVVVVVQRRRDRSQTGARGAGHGVDEPDLGIVVVSHRRLVVVANRIARVFVDPKEFRRHC